MKRLICTTLALALLWGCQKQAEQQPAAQREQAAEQGRQQLEDTPEEAGERKPVSPEQRYSETSKIWLTSAEGRPGEQVKIDIYYYIDEPSKTIALPLTFLGNAVVDSFSWVGSNVANIVTRPVNIKNDLRILSAAVIPMTEPDIPSDSGLFGSIYFTIEKDAQPQTVAIETTFVYPGITLMYVDTLIGAVVPQWEAGYIKVIQ